MQDPVAGHEKRDTVSCLGQELVKSNCENTRLWQWAQVNRLMLMLRSPLPQTRVNPGPEHQPPTCVTAAVAQVLGPVNAGGYNWPQEEHEN